MPTRLILLIKRGVQGLPGRSIIRASLTFANIGVLRTGRAQPLYLLTPAGRFAAFGGNSPPV